MLAKYEDKFIDVSNYQNQLNEDITQLKQDIPNIPVISIDLNKKWNG
jgi:hypothetical protein